ncbi:unnamed protein product [Effrenium voratum]|nr:unnamed protein product [Effrenium voratum]
MAQLPSHLASLLRHRASEPHAVAFGAAVSPGGRVARRRAARAKKREAAKAAKAEAAEAKEAAKAAKAEAKAQAKAEATPEATPEASDPHTQAKKAKKVKKVKEKLKPCKTPKKRHEKATTIFDAEGAVRDEALMRDLEQKLGIAGDEKRRRREERMMFEDLFEGGDLGIEELPSSDDESAGSSTQAAAKQKPQDAENNIVGLLDTILGSGTTRSTTKRTTKVKASGAKKKPKL